MNNNINDINEANVPNIRYNNKILLRKKRLFNVLTMSKLEYKKNGICDSYIKYGKPSLNDVVSTVQIKTNNKISRLNKLLKKLKEENELYDENITYYQEYIRNGGDLNYMVEEGIKEWFYKNKTDYPELLAKYKDEDVAMSFAYNNYYVKKYGFDKYIERVNNKESLFMNAQEQSVA
jgi:hypothetical protein